MQIRIAEIVTRNRIRKDYGNVEELATDIRENGLIHPPVVTSNHILIAGERRVKACRLLGWNEIEVRIMEVRDYEHHLKLEISENEYRKELTHSERVAYAREVERIERVKAAERRRATQNNHAAKAVTENFPEQKAKGETREIVAQAVGYGSGRTYEEAKYVIANGEPDVIAKLDAGEISIYKAYKETKQQQGQADTGELRAIGTEAGGKISVREACRQSKRDPLFKPYVYTPDPHVKAPVLQKMLEEINMAVMLFFVKFEDELLKLEQLGDFEHKIGAYVDAFHKHGNKLQSLIYLKKEYEKDARKIRKPAN